LGLVHRRTHRVEEIGAGVRVGDREDVECVDLLAVCRELLDTEPGPAQQPEGVEGRRALLDTSRLLRHRPSSFLASPVAPVPAGRPLQAYYSRSSTAVEPGRTPRTTPPVAIMTFDLSDTPLVTLDGGVLSLPISLDGKGNALDSDALAQSDTALAALLAGGADAGAVLLRGLGAI